MRQMLERVRRVAALALVAAVAVAAGLFLASYRSLAAPGKARKPSTGATTTRSVDVGHTERGQPATRNYLE